MKKTETFKHFCRTNLLLSNTKPGEREVSLANTVCGTPWRYHWSFTYRVEQKSKCLCTPFRCLERIADYHFFQASQNQQNVPVPMFSLKYLVHRNVIMEYSPLKNNRKKTQIAAKFECLQTQVIAYIFKRWSLSLYPQDISGRYITTRKELICVI